MAGRPPRPKGSIESAGQNRATAGGNPGDINPVRGGLSELRIPYGPGYRVYLTRRGQTLVILLARGDKSSQASDIERAIALAQGLELTEN